MNHTKKFPILHIPLDKTHTQIIITKPSCSQVSGTAVAGRGYIATTAPSLTLHQGHVGTHTHTPLNTSKVHLHTLGSYESLQSIHTPGGINTTRMHYHSFPV